MVIAWIKRLAAWATKKIGSSTLISLICLGIVLGSIAVGLGVILQGQDSVRLTTISFSAMLIAWALAGSPLRGGQAGLFIAVLGGTLVLLGAEGLSNRLFAFLESIVQFISSFAGWRIDQPLPDSRLVFQLGDAFMGTALGILNRTASWLLSFVQGKSTFDLLVVTMVWNLLFWCVSGWAAWGTRRLSAPLVGVLPAAAIFSAALSFTRAEAFYLVPVFVGTLLLIAWQNYSGHEQRWLQQATDFAEDLRFDAAMWSMAFIVIITGGAMLLSGFSPQKSLKFARDLLQPRTPESEEAGNILGLENPSSGVGEGEFSNPGVLPRRHLLGSGPELNQKIVMLVQVEHETPIDQDCAKPPCSVFKNRFYWRLLTFDLYTGRGWMTSATHKIQYMKGEQTFATENPDQIEFVQRYKILEDLGTQLYSFGEPLGADQDFQVFWRTAPEGEKDLFSAQFSRAPTQGTYQVTSAHPPVEEQDLRQSKADYPDWIRERYLQLPKDTPDRIFDLSRELTQDLSSPYEKATAIERYLRTIPYSLNVPLAPADRDIVDYYLYDIRSGYCDYSATAMVVLARAAGLPARIAIGFASGQYDPQNDVYIVTEANAHSWVQVYFPQIGWIEFEPTSGQPELLRQNAASQPPSSELTQPGAQPQTPGLLMLSMGSKFLAGVALFLGILVSAWLAFDSLRLNRMKTSSVVLMLYRRLWRAAAHLGLQTAASETPHEFARRFGERVTGQSRPGLRSFLSPADVEIRGLASLYAQAVYGPRELNENKRRIAISLWKGLWLRLRMAWIYKFLNLMRK